jgi:hypothetical protein
MRGLGAILILAGILLLGGALAIDTSATTGFGAEVSNLGGQHKQLVTVLYGATSLLSGIMLVGFGDLLAFGSFAVREVQRIKFQNAGEYADELEAAEAARKARIKRDAIIASIAAVALIAMFLFAR